MIWRWFRDHPLIPISKGGTTFLVLKGQPIPENWKAWPVGPPGQELCQKDYWAKKGYFQGVRYNRISHAKFETYLESAAHFMFLPFEVGMSSFWIGNVSYACSTSLCFKHRTSQVSQAHNWRGILPQVKSYLRSQSNLIEMLFKWDSGL